MKDIYFEIYYYSNTFPAKIFRTFLFLSSLVFLILGFVTGNVKIPASVFAIITINELFLGSLAKTKPEFGLKEKTEQIEKAFILPARYVFEAFQDPFDIASQISKSDEGKFFLDKLGIEKLEKAGIDRTELLNQSYEAASFVKGEYVTEIDLLASYILLSEDSTKILQKKELSNEDVMNVLYWTRNKFKADDFAGMPLKFSGSGAFDSLVYGWNYELKKYSRDLTADVLSSKFPPVISGREKEFEEMVTALSKNESSNVILIGESGTGKTTLVKFLAWASFLGKVSGEVSKMRIFEFYVDKLLAGAASAGELEGRIGDMLSEIEHSGNSIVFIQNIENIFGGGGVNFDISGVLYEYLKSEKIKIIGTTTQASYATFIENKTSVRDLFEEVYFSELDAGQTLLLLSQRVEEIEDKYKIKIKYSALKKSVVLSSVYFPDRFYPGKAINLLESVASNAKIKRGKELTGEDVVSFVEQKTHVAIAEPDEGEKEKLMHLEEKIHARVIGQDEAVKAVSDAMRRLRSGFKNENRPVGVFLFLGPTGVGKTETAKALAEEYFGDQKSLIRIDMSEYQTQEQIKRILGELPGEEYIPNTISDLIEKQPFSLILLDEFEKAHPHLLDIFLAVFDEARLTDNRGKTVNFSNAIIIATSNAGSELIREKGETLDTESLKKELLDQLLRSNVFKPELINRFDDIILFKNLRQGEVKQIAKILLEESFSELTGKQIFVKFDDFVLEKIAKEAYDAEFGARNIKRYIEDNIEDFLSKLILEDKIKKGEKVLLYVDEENKFQVK